MDNVPKKQFNWWIVPGSVFAAFTLGSVAFYLISLNMAGVLMILAGLIGSAFCFYRLMGEGKSRSDGISEKGPVTGEVNAFVIWGQIKDGVKIAFEVEFATIDVSNIDNARWYFEDIKQWLYVVWNDLDDDSKLKPFELPDASYTAPARLAIPLNMGRVTELFQLELSIFDQLKPWILFAAIGVVGFLIFLSGSG